MATRIDSPNTPQAWDYSNLNFHEYLQWAEKYIAARRTDLASENQQVTLQANMPYELRPATAQAGKYPRGVLLVHGLLDSPYSLREIANHLQKQGFLVRAILLPGHGTVPADLLKVGVKEWIEAVKFGLDSLAQDATEVWGLGLSGGASLLLYHALQGYPFTALMLLAPSLKLKNPYARYASLLNTLSHYARTPIWLDATASTDYAKYEAYPVNLAAQAHRLATEVRQLSRRKPCPVPLWIAISEDDDTVDSQAVLEFYLDQPLSNNRMIWYCQKPNGQSRPKVTFRSSAFAADNILDFSHVCLTFSPHNPHYGLNGDFTPPLHKAKQAVNKMVYRGALTRDNMSHYNMQRLTYNPDYDFLLTQLDEFIATVLHAAK